MKFNKYILIDEYPDKDEVKLCIFTRPVYPIRHQDRWNKEVQFASSPSANNLFLLLKIKQAFPIVGDSKMFVINGQTLHLTFIEHDAFGSCMLILQWMDKTDELLLYTGQFTNHNRALMNIFTSDFNDKITDIFIDNLANAEHENSLETACDTVQNYLKEYKGYKVYLDFENLFGYEELLLNLAQRKIKIQLHKAQRAAMTYGNNLQYFDFEGNHDLKVFYRTDRNNWNLEHNKNFFINDKCVYLKFIATQHTKKIDTENIYFRIGQQGKPEPIKSKFKGFHYIVYSPHPSKHTLAKFINFLNPLRIHPLHLPIEYELSNVNPNDIILIPSESVIQSEPEPEPESSTDLNRTLGQIQNNTRMENGQKDSAKLPQSRLSHNSSIPNNRKKTSTKSPPRIINDEPIAIDDVHDPDNAELVQYCDSDVDVQQPPLATIATKLNSSHNYDRDQPTRNQNGMEFRIELNNNGQALDEDIEIVGVHCQDRNKINRLDSCSDTDSIISSLKFDGVDLTKSSLESE